MTFLKEILNNINLKFLSGKIYCIAGSTGSGKSTLLDLILGLLNPIKGEIYLNKKILLEPNNTNWFEKVSYVPQETFVLDDTLSNNISLQNVDEKDQFQIKKIKNSIDISELHSFARSIQNDKIGFRGLKISGGQKQRIGIARALFKNSEVLIMDEATNALDEITEKKILQNIKKNNPQKIIINVSHRIETIKFSDEMIFLEDGEIRFIGKPEKFYLIQK